ncbi:MAG: hypothetical protein J6X55_07230 [Victivallales bacterium]|nr:hypothetical protein [Victivallales bacterium]
MRKITILCLLASCLVVCAEMWKPEFPKLIEFSWNSPDTKYLREHVKEMEARTPYQGLGIHVIVKVKWNGKDLLCRHNTICSPIAWKKEWFAQAIDDLKHTEFKQFTDNFIRTGVCPGNVSLFSDSDWAAVCNNFRIMSEIAKECGMKGLAFDPEVYGEQLFIHNDSWGHTLEESRKQARLRGQQFADAIFTPFPDMTFFCFFWHSHLFSAYYKVGSDTYHDTFIDFVNGIYDHLPPTVSIIDGNETNGYRAAEEKDFEALNSQVFYKYMTGIDMVNFAKARTQVHVAPAFYLDPYFINSKNSWAGYLKWDTKPDRTRYFIENLSHAAKVADKYIWTWGENGSWWRDKPGELYSWESRSPGVTKALRRFVTNEPPTARLTGNEPNMLKNHDFEDLKGYDAAAKSPKVAEWSFWQSRLSKGTYGLENLPNGGHGVFFSNILNACFLQTHPAEYGDTYVFSAKVWRSNPNEKASVTIRWQDENGRWCSEEADRSEPAGKPGEDGWCTVTVVAKVPASAHKISVLLSGADVKGKVVFDDAKLVKCPIGD